MSQGHENVPLQTVTTHTRPIIHQGIQETQQHENMNQQIQQQQIQQAQINGEKRSWFSRKKDYFVMRNNPAGNKDHGVENSENKVVEQIHGYHEVKQSDDYNHAIAKQTERNNVLLEMCAKEKNISHASKEFKETLSLIEDYAKAVDYDTQQSSLKKALKGINDYINKFQNAKTDNEYELLERIKIYSYYFDTSVNGSLKVDKEVPLQKNPSAGVLNTWKDVSDYKLFPHEPSVHDVKQRWTEDCYMLSSLSAIAYQNPEQIKESIKDNGDGTVTVRFYTDEGNDVFYEEESTESICAQGLETEEQKAKVLTKLISKYFKDESFVKECVKDRNKTTGFAHTRQQQEPVNEEATNDEVINIEATEVETTTDIINDEFGDFEDVIEFVTEVKKEQSSKTTDDGLDENTYKNNVKSTTDLFKGNNKEHLESMLKLFLGAENKLHIILDEVIKGLKEGVSENVERQLMKNLMHEMIIQQDSKQGFATFNRELENNGVYASAYKPVYVRVKKEISTLAGGIELNATDSLWVQMIEKAYAAKFGTHGTKTGYAGISLGNSSDFLKRFTNQDYDNRNIYDGKKTDVKDEDGNIIISETDLNKAIKGIEHIENMSVTIENIIKIIKDQPAYAEMSEDTIGKIVHELEMRGFSHDEFSGVYSEKAEDFFEDAKERLERKETITVGVDLNKSYYNDKKKRTSELNATGIRVGHAYAIIRCFEADGHKFVTLRDPYGLYRRKYDVEKQDGKIVKVEKQNASDFSLAGTDTMGMFNMELNDFMLAFNVYSGIKHNA